MYIRSNNGSVQELLLTISCEILIVQQAFKLVIIILKFINFLRLLLLHLFPAIF